MKLLQVVEASAAGVGRHVMDLTAGLLQRGHEVHLVYSDVRSDGVFEHDLQALSTDGSFRARRILMRRAVGALDVLAVRSLRRYVRTHGPFDLVHCHSTKAGLVGCLGLLGCSVCCVYSPHLFFSMDPTQGRLKVGCATGFDSALAGLCDAVVAVSRREHTHALRLRVPRSRLFLVPHGVVEAPGNRARGRGEIRGEWKLRDGEVCVGFVGRLVSFKRPDVLIRAFAELLRRSTASGVRLVVIGDGPLAGPCRNLAAQLAVDSRVVWLGERDAKTVMHAFDVLAVTSDTEAGPLVVLEAMARGIPVVATSVGLVPDAVRDAVSGFIVPVRDATAIANSLRTLVNDAALRESMGRMSRVLAQEFSVDRMVERTLEVYREVAGGVRDGRPAREMTAAVGR